MMQKLFLIASLLVCSGMQAQQLLDRVGCILSPMERDNGLLSADALARCGMDLYASSTYAELRSQCDTMAAGRLRSFVYTGLSAGKTDGDFLPYEGTGSQDYRVGAYGEYATQRTGTLSGAMQYAQGRHRDIGWSSLRLPELYWPYVSTDSIGGDFKYDSYYVHGNYAFTLHEWTLGVRASFEGEQAYRLSDPRALNNTTWLRLGTGLARRLNGHLLMLDAGYGRNKQHMQLRYWRPGQQDRFFVCYGFGLYDTRQSGVAFGKARMYYDDQLNVRLQYLSPVHGSPLTAHLSMAYAYDHMRTEESDIYNLYERRTHILRPQVSLGYEPVASWRVDFLAYGDMQLRRGYENIIEEYLIDKDNNIYDFRTIDTQQNYRLNQHRLTAALRIARRINAPLELSLQAGLTNFHRKEQYKDGLYLTEVNTLTPHVRLGMANHGRRGEVEASFTCGRQSVGTHRYDVQLQNQQIAHLDFQQAFSPYAYYACEYDYCAAGFTIARRLGHMRVGLAAQGYVVRGNRLPDVIYTGTIGFPSTAPMLRPQPDRHRQQWGSLTMFLSF